MKFEITAEQEKQVNDWVKERYRKIAKEQLEDPDFPESSKIFVTEDSPYFGAIGGELTYSFSPTGLGNVVVVTLCEGTKWEAKLNITDYDSW